MPLRRFFFNLISNIRNSRTGTVKKFKKFAVQILTECAYILKLKLAVNVSGNDSSNRCGTTKLGGKVYEF